uniref:Uncharacterized protein n=1 Tax=Rhizophora mucronata TaxID=61149 RepID=A0A2P2IHL6_RHIMU
MKELVMGLSSSILVIKQQRGLLAGLCELGLSTVRSHSTRTTWIAVEKRETFQSSTLYWISNFSSQHPNVVRDHAI